MSDSITVRAREGVSVPMEHDPRRKIGMTAVRVENSPYYRRRVKEGDLLVVAPGKEA